MSRSPQTRVIEFVVALGGNPEGSRAVWMHCLEEEYQEVQDARTDDELAHELADLVYSAYGLAAAADIDLDAVIEEVHRSNMTKTIDPVRRPDGKVTKGPHYRPPDVAGVLRHTREHTAPCDDCGQPGHNRVHYDKT